MIGKNEKERVCAKALQTLAYYAQQISIDSTMSIDDRMKTLQWMLKSIPKINRLLIEIKTREITK